MDKYEQSKADYNGRFNRQFKRDHVDDNSTEVKVRKETKAETLNKLVSRLVEISIEIEDGISKMTSSVNGMKRAFNKKEKESVDSTKGIPSYNANTLENQIELEKRENLKLKYLKKISENVFMKDKGESDNTKTKDSKSGFFSKLIGAGVLGGLVAKFVPKFIRSIFKNLFKVVAILFNPLKLLKLLARLNPLALIAVSIVKGLTDAFKSYKDGGSVKDIIGNFITGIFQFFTFGLVSRDKVKAQVDKVFDSFVNVINWIIKNVINRIPFVELGLIPTTDDKKTDTPPKQEKPKVEETKPNSVFSGIKGWLFDKFGSDDKSQRTIAPPPKGETKETGYWDQSIDDRLNGKPGVWVKKGTISPYNNNFSGVSNEELYKQPDFTSGIDIMKQPKKIKNPHGTEGFKRYYEDSFGTDIFKNDYVPQSILMQPPAYQNMSTKPEMFNDYSDVFRKDLEELKNMKDNLQYQQMQSIIAPMSNTNIFNQNTTQVKSSWRGFGGREDSLSFRQGSKPEGE